MAPNLGTEAAVGRPVVMDSPFLDLPAEMRNRIYDIALTHNRKHDQVATVALLRTCKQVHQEAVGIFKAKSNFTLTIDSKVSNRTCRTTMAGDMRCSLDDPSIITLAKKLPTAMLESDVVCVDVVLSRDKSITLDSIDRTDFAILNRFLYALVHHLNYDRKPRGLVLELEDTEIAQKLKDPNDIHVSRFADLF